MASSRISSDEMDPVKRFMAVTGTSRTVAESMLEACAGDLDLAVGMHMDGGTPGIEAGSSNGASSAPTVPAAGDDEDAVRAPIPQRTEVLMEEDVTRISWRMKRPRPPVQSVFDGFRDFQSEATHYEEMHRGKRPSKKKNLEELFRPPVEITFKGTFQNARDFGSSKNKWLLVNVQNVQEFPCQMLNRDVWSNQEARAVIKDHFVFWQVYNDSEEGKRYMQFYKFKQWPYVAILDPFTGENQIEWNKISDGTVFCELAKDFLSSFPVPDTSQVSNPSKRQKREPSIVDATEEEQLKAAIEASLTKPSSPQYVMDSDSEPNVIEDSDDEVETFSDSDDVLETTGPIPASNGNHKDKSSPVKSSTTSSAAKQSTQSPLSLSSSSSSSLSIQGHSIPLRKLQSDSSSTTTSSSSPSKQASSSIRSGLSSHRAGVRSGTNSSEIRISPRDLIEAGGSGNVGSDLWASSQSGSQSSVRNTDSPLEVNIENSLMDMIGGRDSEVCTPEVPTPEVVDSSSNSRSSLPDREKEREQAEDDSVGLAQDWKEFWGDEQDPKSRIMLRFPDNKREQVELPCSSSLKALTTLCSARGFPPDKYELVTNFPRRQLSKLAPETTVKEAGLHPQESVFVQDL